MVSLSLCMIVRDESEVLARCLASVAGAVDEMIVVDTGSVDDTPAIARSFGARVHTFEWIDDFAAARNRSFDFATGSYILWLDADDVLLPEDREKLLALKPRLEKDIYWLPYDYEQDAFGISLLRFHRERIVRNTPEIRWASPIHETLTIGPDMSGEYVDITVSHRRTPSGRARDRGRGISLLERLLALPEHAGDAYLHFDLGREYEAAGLREEASRSYERFRALAGPLSEDDAWVFEHMARHHLRLSEEEPPRAAEHRRRARLCAEEARRLDPGRAEPCVLLGRIAEAEAYPEEAILWYGRALRPLPERGFLAPADYTVVPAERLSALWLSLGDPLKANAWNEAALAWSPRDPILLLTRSRLRARIGASR
jgi:tetratricopeptide (TPR) repeat protein